MFAFSALADPNRLRIVEMLASHGQLSVNDIKNQFTISAPAISQHLKVLRQAQLVSVEIRAQQRLYTINLAGMTAMEQWLDQMRHLWTQRFDALDELLITENKPSKEEK